MVNNEIVSKIILNNALKECEGYVGFNATYYSEEINKYGD